MRLATLKLLFGSCCCCCIVFVPLQSFAQETLHERRRVDDESSRTTVTTNDYDAIDDDDDDDDDFSQQQQKQLEFFSFSSPLPLTAEASCTSQTDCESCYNLSYACHWCDSDQACHAKGSVHGCAIGSSCHHGKDDDNNNKKNETDACSIHMTCSECALSSHLCHWCAHDNACHVIGSVYGCTVGVDCFSNDRCKRKEPEPIKTEGSFRTVNALPLVALTVLGGLIVCCASVCFFMAGGVKGAYDDLAGMAASGNLEEDGGGGGGAVAAAAAADNTTDTMQQPLLEDAATEGEVESQQQQQQQHVVRECADLEEHEHEREQSEEAVGDEEEAAPAATASVEDTNTATMYTAQQSVQTAASVSRRSRRSSDHMQRLYNVCAGCYVITIATVAITLLTSFQFYPKVPEYNVCNDAVAWKSLIDSLASAKVSADFEILITVANPNHFDIDLDMGKGSFTHQGAFVGTFDIPPVTVPAMTLTDLMLITHLSPERWEALSLTAAYYRGKLVLDVSAKATIRVPALFDLTYRAKLSDFKVNVNEQSDRSLCHCPTWDDPRNETMVIDVLAAAGETSLN